MIERFTHHSVNKYLWYAIAALCVAAIGYWLTFEGWWYAQMQADELSLGMLILFWVCLAAVAAFFCWEELPKHYPKVLLAVVVVTAAAGMANFFFIEPLFTYWYVSGIALIGEFFIIVGAFAVILALYCVPPLILAVSLLVACCWFLQWCEIS